MHFDIGYIIQRLFVNYVQGTRVRGYRVRKVNTLSNEIILFDIYSQNAMVYDILFSSEKCFFSMEKMSLRMI